MKKIIISAITIILLVSISIFTHFFGNMWHLTTESSYFIPAESNIFTFNATKWNDGSGDWWLYGEDKQYYYGLNTEDTIPKYFALHKGLEPEKFDKLDYDTWFVVQMDTIPQKADIALPKDTVKYVIDSTLRITRISSKYHFNNFKTEIYTGKLAKPIFTKKELAECKLFVERITEGCEENGINFCGHYTIIQTNCGCMCQGIDVIDRISGKIFQNIKFNKDSEYGKWGYLYKPDSKLLIANSESLIYQDSLIYYTDTPFEKPELWIWTDKKFKRLQ